MTVTTRIATGPDLGPDPKSDQSEYALILVIVFSIITVLTLILSPLYFSYEDEREFKAHPRTRIELRTDMWECTQSHTVFVGMVVTSECDQYTRKRDQVWRIP